MENLDKEVRATPWTAQVTSSSGAQPITVPSNYGCIFLL
jgi:hypothetical protein